MKLVILYLSLIAATTGRCSTIDQLQTTKDVEAFVLAQNPKYNSSEVPLEIPSTEALAQQLDCNGIFKAWEIKNWEKADVNNDGRTDLLVLAQWHGPHPFIVLDLDESGYQFVELNTDSFEYCELYKPIKHQQLTLLKAYRPKPSKRGLVVGTPAFSVDTLGFYKNTLLRYNPTPKQETISRISLKTSACFGSCPEFELELLRSGRVNFNGIEHTPAKGKQSFNISPDDFQEIQALINYINIRALNNSYAVNWTDDQTAYLDISFTDGTEKHIRDYGLQGTAGLKALYTQLFAIMNRVNAM